VEEKRKEFKCYYLHPCIKLNWMHNLQTLTKSQLVDLLNKEMTCYYSFTSDRAFKKELTECKKTIKEIQEEIAKRKNKCCKEVVADP
jgi:hypothetical protein